MGLYEIAKIAVGVMIFLLGAFMFFFPKLCLKKQEREIEYAQKDMRKRGGILMIVIVVVSIVMLAAPFIAGLMA
ncbi:MAG: hypothetical protein J6A80_03000 [Lachnospiraceae bacterium]|nr:hypothetical protein [Lachnospiraceae bacterium]